MAIVQPDGINEPVVDGPETLDEWRSVARLAASEFARYHKILKEIIEGEGAAILLYCAEIVEDEGFDDEADRLRRIFNLIKSVEGPVHIHHLCSSCPDCGEGPHIEPAPHKMDGWQEFAMKVDGLYRSYRYRIDDPSIVEHATRNGYQPAGKKFNEGVLVGLKLVGLKLVNTINKE